MTKYAHKHTHNTHAIKPASILLSSNRDLLYISNRRWHSKSPVCKRFNYSQFDYLQFLLISNSKVFFYLQILIISNLIIKRYIMIYRYLIKLGGCGLEGTAREIAYTSNTMLNPPPRPSCSRPRPFTTLKYHSSRVLIRFSRGLWQARPPSEVCRAGDVAERRNSVAKAANRGGNSAFALHCDVTSVYMISVGAGRLRSPSTGIS